MPSKMHHGRSIHPVDFLATTLFASHFLEHLQCRNARQVHGLKMNSLHPENPARFGSYPAHAERTFPFLDA